MSKKSGTWKKWLVVLIVLGVGGYIVQRQMGGETASLEFRTAPVVRGALRQIVTASGQLEPVINVEVGSQISGTLEEIYVDFNSIVTNQQPLARIDARSYENALKQAQGELANANASLELAEINARRAAKLHKDNLISQSEYDTAVAELHKAQASKMIREASMDRASVDLSRTTVYSPIDGIVISRNIEVGQTVAASFNTPKLFRIANDLSEMHIHASVSEADIGGVAEGQDVEFAVDAFPTVKMSGIVHQVRNAAVTNQNVITYTTVIAVQNSGSKLKPGMTANVEITLAEAKDVLHVPNAAFRVRVPEGVEVIGKPADAAPSAAEGLGERRQQLGGNGGSGGERRRLFLERFDKNKDGRLDESERAALPEGFRKPGGGQGFGGGRRGGRPPRDGSGPKTQTVYLLEPGDDGGETAPRLKAAPVRTGISDGASTVVLTGLSESDEVVTAILSIEGSRSSSASANPFGPSFGRGRGGRR